MRWLYHYAVPSGLLVARDELVLMEELVVSGILVNADALAHVRDRDRVAHRADHHQGVIGDPSCLHALVTIGRSRAQWRQSFVGEALRRPLMGGAVDAHVGDLGAPALKPAVELLQ
jgi:hypothetical protein